MNLHPMELRGAVGAMTLAALLSAQAAGQTTNDAARATATERPDGLIELPGQGDGGDVPILAATYTDDEVPLPIPAEYVAGPQGDTLAAPASGDPHFLGFVAGRYYPPAEETLDPLLLAQLQSQYLDGRPAAETYAFVMFARRMTPERIAALEALGCRPLGYHPHYTMRVALPVTAIDAVAALDFVRWIGVPRPWQKVHRHLQDTLRSATPNLPLAAYVNVFDSDLNPSSTLRRLGAVAVAAPGGAVEPGAPESGAELWMSNGWQQRALESLGVEVLAYVDRTRAFQVRLLPSALESVVALDFVQFVESDVTDITQHDESTPAVLADRVRVDYDGGTNGVAITGQIDSGMDVAHQSLNHIYAVGWDLTPDAAAWLDNCEHGTHVAGTILGLPQAGFEGYTGNAPALGSAATLRVRNMKRFWDVTCAATNLPHTSYYSVMRSDYTDGSGNVSAKPHAINNSWGADPGGTAWIGSEENARILDAEVWDYSQFYVFSAGNAGSGAGTIGLPAVAKNAFTVGSVVDFETTVGDPGNLWTSSSRGPCGDDRWKPNASAPGRFIRSANAGSGTGYIDKSGTSMAAPHVTGLAATMCDHFSWARYAPHRIAAHMMATAMTHADALLTNDTDWHLDNYGTGRINAVKAHYGAAGYSWLNWGFTLSSGSWTYGDFTVPAGTTRVVVCMAYHEDQCSSGASKALVNDINLYIDSPTGGIDPAGNTGEYIAQQSAVDNTEIRILSSPTAGTWRWKTWSQSTSSSSRVSISVVFISADTTPDGTLDVVANDSYVQPNADVTITATAYNPEYFASNVFLDSSSSGDTLQSSRTTLRDGIVTDLMTNQHLGRDVLLGTIQPANSRVATWVTRWATEGVKTWTVEARSDNWVDKLDSTTIYVDGTPPALPTSLISTSHTINVWSNDSSVDFTWTGSTDNVSGVDGYGESYGATLPVFISNVKDMEEVTAFTRVLPDGSWYWALRPVDYSGNWNASSASIGPLKIDLAAPSGPGVISSTTHTAGVQSCNTSVNLAWTAATDALSGLAGYCGVWDTSAATDPVGALNIGAAATGLTTNIGSSTSPRYFHLRAQDSAGNWGTTRHFGPVLANATSVSSYCTAKTNSLGCVPAIGTNGVQPDKSSGNFTVLCTNVLNQKYGLLFWGFTPSAVPFQGGYKCVGQPSVRTPSFNSGGATTGTSCTGSYAFTFTTAYMTSEGINPGQTVYAQYWMRDPASPSTTGLSNAVRFTVCE